MDMTVQNTFGKPLMESSLNSYALDVALTQIFSRISLSNYFCAFTFSFKASKLFLKTSVIHREVNVNSRPVVFWKNLGDFHENICDGIFFQYGFRV